MVRAGSGPAATCSQSYRACALPLTHFQLRARAPIVDQDGRDLVGRDERAWMSRDPLRTEQRRCGSHLTFKPVPSARAEIITGEISFQSFCSRISSSIGPSTCVRHGHRNRVRSPGLVAALISPPSRRPAQRGRGAWLVCNGKVPLDQDAGEDQHAAPEPLDRLGRPPLHRPNRPSELAHQRATRAACPTREGVRIRCDPTGQPSGSQFSPEGRTAPSEPPSG
jgi:hypothetical protein